MKGFTEAKKQKKKSGYQTPKRLKQGASQRRPVVTATARPRALGGHQ